MEIPTTMYKLGDSFAVRIPADIVKALKLKEMNGAMVKDIGVDKIEISFTK